MSTWLAKHKQHNHKMDSEFIQHHLQNNHQNPFEQFYVTYKIHKGMKNNKWPTRPVCSNVSSLPHGLGTWVEQMLQSVTPTEPTYLKNSYRLKNNIHPLHRPPVPSYSPAMLNLCTHASQPSPPSQQFLLTYEPTRTQHSTTIDEAL